MAKNGHKTLASSSTRSGKNTFQFENSGHRGAIFYVDVTASSGDGTEDLQVDIDLRDPTSGKALELMTDTFSNGTTAHRVYAIYPGISDTQSSFDKIEESPLPFRIEVVAETLQGGSSPDHTYSISVDRLV